MIVLRPLEQADVEAVAAIETASFSSPWRQEDFLAFVKEKDKYYLVAEEEGSIIGGCGMHNIAGEGEITNVVIIPAKRQQGIATAMLKRLLTQGRRMGSKAFTLEVRKTNSVAIHLYEKMGFRQEGLRKNFYEKPQEDAVIMWKR